MPATPITLTPQAHELNWNEAQREAWAAEHAVEPVYSSEDGFLTGFHVEDLRFRPKPNWLIENIVEEDGLTVFFAGDKLGKTAILSSMLWAWVDGRGEWLDEQFQMFDPTNGTPRSVLYVLLEGQGTYYERFDAWRNKYAKGDTALGDNFVVTTDQVVFYDGRMKADDPDSWPESLKRLALTIQHMKPSILVIDTFARATPGVDENSSQVGLVVGALDKIRNEHKTATILVHHTSLGDDDRPRGWSGLKSAASSYVWIQGNQKDKVRKFGTGPHRNSDYTTAIPFQLTSAAGAFYVERASSKRAAVNEGDMRMLVELRELGGWRKRIDFADPEDGITTANSRLKRLEEALLVTVDKSHAANLYMATETPETI